MAADACSMASSSSKSEDYAKAARKTCRMRWDANEQAEESYLPDMALRLAMGASVLLVLGRVALGMSWHGPIRRTFFWISMGIPLEVGQMSRHVRAQKTRVIKSRKDASHTEQSQYWDDASNRGRKENGDGVDEHPQANPDMLPEMANTGPSTPQLLMGEAIEHLQGRQREVYILTMREDKSLAEAAEILGIEKGSAQKYKERAIKFIEGYCKAAIAKGRV